MNFLQLIRVFMQNVTYFLLFFNLHKKILKFVDKLTKRLILQKTPIVCNLSLDISDYKDLFKINFKLTIKIRFLVDSII